MQLLPVYIVLMTVLLMFILPSKTVQSKSLRENIHEQLTDDQIVELNGCQFPGNYCKSCIGCKFIGSYLTCSCKNKDNEFYHTLIDPLGCFGTIENDDGDLVCVYNPKNIAP